MKMKHWLVRGIGATHAAFVAAAAGALPAAIIWPRTQFIAATGLVGLLAAWALWRDCPLTIWEQRLRAKLQLPALDGGFIRHHVTRLTGLRIPERTHQNIQFAYLGILAAVILL